jgi:hypothetical protein
VIFRKVTNGFRSEWCAKTYAALCSIVETVRRNSRSAPNAACDAVAPAADPAYVGRMHPDARRQKSLADRVGGASLKRRIFVTRSRRI